MDTYTISEYRKLLFSHTGTSKGKNHLFSLKYRDVKTFNGYEYDTVKSAIQKFIRRGRVFQAQQMVGESDMFRFSGYFKPLEEKEKTLVKSSITNLVNRLKVIYLEDIGLANPCLIMDINTLFEKWLAVENCLSASLLHLVKLMADSKKTRYYSHVRMWYKYNKPILEKSELYIVKKGDENFHDFSRGLYESIISKSDSAYYWIHKILETPNTVNKYNSSSTRSGYLIFYILEKVIGKEGNEIVKKTISICKSWYSSMKNKEQFLCCVHPVYLYMFFEKVEKIEIDVDSYEENPKALQAYNSVLLREKMFFPEYVIDMHTKKGRMMGRNSSDFAIEGSLVAYEKEFNSTFSDFYKSQKIKESVVHNESDEYKLKVRAQLVCSFSRQDTYFARNRLNQNVVVKGPYIFLEDAMRIFNIQKILSLFSGINTLDVNIRLLRPDMFREENKTVVGIRLKTEQTQNCYFVIMNDLFDRDEYPVKIRSSKLWPETKVFDYEKMFEEEKKYGYGNVENMSEKAKFSFLLQLVIRYVFRMGDFATRNFVRIEDKVYNLDTEGVNIGDKIRFSENDKKILRKVLEKNKDRYRDTLQSWLDNNQVWEKVDFLFPNVPITIGGPKSQKDEDNFRNRLEKMLSSEEHMYEFLL